MRWIGLAMSLVGIGFVIAQLGAYADDPGNFRPTVLQVLLLAAVYGVSNVMLAVAWRDLLEHCGAPSSVGWAVHVFGITQLAKYIPGNSCHLASRQTIGMSDGHEAMPLLKSVLWEFGAILTSAAVFGLWLGPSMFQGVSYSSGGSLFAVVLAIVYVSAWRYLSSLVMRAVLWHVGFLLLSGLIFYATLQLLAHETSLVQVPPGICSAYIIAWLAGAITPGAPAGIGIREVVMFALLQPLVAGFDLRVAIVLNRAITAAGDTLFYFFTLTFGNASLRPAG